MRKIRVKALKKQFIGVNGFAPNKLEFRHYKKEFLDNIRRYGWEEVKKATRNLKFINTTIKVDRGLYEHMELPHLSAVKSPTKSIKKLTLWQKIKKGFVRFARMLSFR